MLVRRRLAGSRHGSDSGRVGCLERERGFDEWSARICLHGLEAHHRVYLAVVSSLWRFAGYCVT